MDDLTLLIDGVRVPRFLYGTAWKEERTQALTELALRQGFRGIDTANQRRHYHEVAVGKAIQSSIESGVVARDLGISNVTVEQVERLCQEARVRPRFVQNRCLAATGWDRGVRSFCAAHGLVYQGFSLLTANRQILAHPEVGRMAARHSRTVGQIVFRFALDVGMIPLTGTSDAEHMRVDLEVFNFQLEPEEVDRIERLAEGLR